MRARVAKKTSSSRRRVASSGLHMARVLHSGPVNGAQIRVRQHHWAQGECPQTQAVCPEVRPMSSPLQS